MVCYDNVIREQTLKTWLGGWVDARFASKAGLAFSVREVSLLLPSFYE